MHLGTGRSKPASPGRSSAWPHSRSRIKWNACWPTSRTAPLECDQHALKRYHASVMKALLLSEYNRLNTVEVPMPRPGPDEVLVRVAACGICGSDVHGYDGTSGRRI